MSAPLSLGVITSLSPDPAKALEYLSELGIPTAQISYPADLDNPEGLAAIEKALAETGIEITTVFCGFPGESYADLPTVQATVGLIPPGPRAERVETVKRIARFTQKLGVKRVAAHIGFVPEDHSDPQHKEIVNTVRGICDYLAELGLDFALETGQETGAGLHHFIQDVEEGGKRSNLKVNFDPANMILYGNDQPIPATRLLFPWIDGVHCKDGNWPTEQGKLGVEMPLGQGQVDVPAWIATLLELGYQGPLTIEREIHGEQQRKDILAAKDLLLGLLPA